MSRKGWLLVAGVCAGLVVQLIVLDFIFRPQGPKAVGGPVLIAKGDLPKHGFLGVDFGTVTTAPLTVRSVVKNSPAAEAGLQSGDVILAAGAAEKPDLAALQRVVQASAPGEELLLKIGRGRDEMEVRARLISFPDMVLLREQDRSGGTAP